MLSFSTEFPVAIEDVDEFASVVTHWVAGSPHSNIAKELLNELPNGDRWTVEADGERLQALIVRSTRENIGAFRYIKRDGDIEWCTEAVYSFNQSDAWTGIRTSCESHKPQLNLPSAKKPHLVKTVLERAGGGLDGELYVRDIPHQIRENDLPMAARLLNGDSENYLPIVYISSSFDGEVLIDSNALARTLGGLAHVLVETDSLLAAELQDLTSSRNVYNGAVGVYWPDGDHYRYFPGGDYASEYDLRMILGGRLRASLTNRRPLTRCTWTRAEAEAAHIAFADLRTKGSEDVDAYIAAFDAEMQNVRAELEQAEREITRLKAQRGELQTASGEIGLRSGTEKNLYPGELQSLVLDELSKCLNNVQGDSRRQHILQAILNSTPQTGVAREKREILKELLRNYSSMSAIDRRSLEEMGFSITEEGKHYKLVFSRDERYTFALAKSGSDRRGGLNAASDIGKRLF